MDSRTDLAIEVLGSDGVSSKKGDGYSSSVIENESTVTTVIDIENEKGADFLGKPIGRYVTVEVPPFGKDGEVTDGRLDAVANQLSNIIPKSGDVLVVGLGNRDITADALGPIALSQLLATRHLNDRLSNDLGLDDLRNVSGIIPGVLGQTGIEVSDIVKSVSKLVKPAVIICVDALAARDLERLGTTVQITDAGVAPGSGIGNSRPKINSETMGIPVISVGVPTVISVLSLIGKDEEEINETKINKFNNLIVTPKDIDLLVSRAAKLIALSLNRCLFPVLSLSDILSLVS